MATLVTGSVPAEQFALAETFTAHPELTFRIEKLVRSGENAVMPWLWTRNVPADELEETLREDRTVDSVELLTEHEDESLYEMKWIDNIQLILQMITNAEATVLNAVGEGNQWKLRVLYPEREKYSTTSEFCETHGVDFEVASIRDVDHSSASRYGLTREQRDTFIEAARRGYFKIPREITLEELADEMGVSHQALSERLRRGNEALVENTLLFEGDVDVGKHTTTAHTK